MKAPPFYGNRTVKRSVYPYVWSIVVPPAGLVMYGKPLQPMQLVVNLALTLCFWVPGAVHAVVLVRKRLTDKPTRRVVQAMRSKWR